MRRLPGVLFCDNHVTSLPPAIIGPRGLSATPDMPEGGFTARTAPRAGLPGISMCPTTWKFLHFEADTVRPRASSPPLHIDMGPRSLRRQKERDPAQDGSPPQSRRTT